MVLQKATKQVRNVQDVPSRVVKHVCFDLQLQRGVATLGACLLLFNVQLENPSHKRLSFIPIKSHCATTRTRCLQ